MNIYFAQDGLPVSSIFLAGPTPRADTNACSWLPEALCILSDALQYRGNVLVPATDNVQPFQPFDSNGQPTWVRAAILRATVVVIWVPRDNQRMFALTSNSKFGPLMASGKVVLGFSAGTSGTRYLRKLADRFSIPVHDNLFDTLAAAVTKAEAPFRHTFSSLV